MSYAEVHRTIGDQQRIIKLTFHPAYWGKSYDDLHRQTPVGVNDIWSAGSSNNFVNPFMAAMQDIHDRKRFLCLITRDVIVGSGAQRDEKGLKIKAYKTRAGTDLETVHNNLVIPPDGYFVPTKDGIFHPDTGVPYETVGTKREARKRWEANSLDPEYVSRIWSPDYLKDGEEKYAGCISSLGEGKCYFDIRLNMTPFERGIKHVASLPSHEPNPAFVVRIDE
ncbi:MAG: hypothetical protein HY513_03160 [Candidatus Aenigmarchaeota archaeon]|nr:hypothetical protein [Candidatus Aenigmarchaeota archaeon]